MNITLRQLKAFLAGTKSSSFSEAAARSYLTQPGYSLLIRQLEAELGLKLFDRTTRRVEITKTGKELGERLERIIADLESTLQDTRVAVARKFGRVTLGLMPSAAASMLGPIVETLGKNAPEIVLSIREELSGPLSEMVTNGIVDLAVGVDMFMNDSVTFTPLTQDPMVGVFHPDEPLLANDSISWRDVAQLPFISFAQSSIEHGVAEAFAEAQVRLQPRFEVKFAATAVSLVLAKAGFAVLPNLALKLVNLDGVVIRPILPTVQRNVGILVHSYHSLSPAAAFIRDSILGAASKLTS